MSKSVSPKPGVTGSDNLEPLSSTVISMEFPTTLTVTFILVTSGFLFAFATINFAHMAIILFVFSMVLCVSVSLITAEPDYVKTRGLSFGNLDLSSKEFKEKTYSTVDVILSVILVLMVIGILMYFTG